MRRARWGQRLRGGWGIALASRTVRDYLAALRQCVRLQPPDSGTRPAPLALRGLFQIPLGTALFEVLKIVLLKTELKHFVVVPRPGRLTEGHPRGWRPAK